MPFQVSIFAENKPGKIEKVTGLLKEDKINIKAVTISDSGDYGIIKLLLDRPEDGHRKLKEAGIAATLKSIIAVHMTDRPGALHEVSSVLKNHGINVDDAYGFILNQGRNAVFVFQTENTSKAEKVLAEEGFPPLSDKELYFEVI
jgi:hypothetical protein